MVIFNSYVKLPEGNCFFGIGIAGIYASYMEVIWKLYGRYMEVIWKLYGSYMEVIWKL